MQDDLIIKVASHPWLLGKGPPIISLFVVNLDSAHDRNVIGLKTHSMSSKREGL